MSSILGTSNAFAKSTQLPVPFFYQDDACWCGIATAEMYMHYVTNTLNKKKWKWYSARQTNIWKLHKNRVGRFSEYISKAQPCGKKGGVSPREMVIILKKGIQNRTIREASSYVGGRERSYKSADFHSQVIKMIEKTKVPIPVAGNTIYWDGTKKLGAHWFMITGVKYADKNHLNPTKDGYYIYDSTYNSPHTSKVKSVPKGRFVTHHTFMNKYAFISNNRVNYIYFK